MVVSNIPDDIHWLSQDEYDKAIGQLRLQVGAIFDFLKVDDKLPVRYMYGYEPFIRGAVNEIVKLAEDFGLRVRGVDRAISIVLVRRNGR